MEFAIGTFDHSQIIRELKFQIGGHSSSVTLVTSRIFIRPIIPHGLTRLLFPTERPDIVYLEQNIPSEFGVPEFEDIVSLTPDDYSDEKYRTVNISMDITGGRVDQYVKMVSIAHKLKMFRGLIPFWCKRSHSVDGSVVCGQFIETSDIES